MHPPVRSPQPVSFYGHTVVGQRKTSREGKKQPQIGSVLPAHTSLFLIWENSVCISWRFVVITQLPKWSVFSPAEGVQKRENTAKKRQRGRQEVFILCQNLETTGARNSKERAWLTIFPSHAFRSQSNHQGRASPRCLLGVKPHTFIWLLTVGCIHITY